MYEAALAGMMIETIFTITVYNDLQCFMDRSPLLYSEVFVIGLYVLETLLPYVVSSSYYILYICSEFCVIYFVGIAYTKWSSSSRK